MKRILSIILSMLMLVSVICIAPISTSAAEVDVAQTGANLSSDGTARLYFNIKAVSWWSAGNNGDGNFGYFFSNSTGKNAWSAHAENYSGDTYYLVIPEGTWECVILTRNNTSTSPSWSNKWNQSGDITLSATSNYISKFAENSTSVTWGTAIKPASTVSVTASAAETLVDTAVTLTTALTSNADINTLGTVAYTVEPETATVTDGVFTATEAGEYTVTATALYAPNGYASLTSEASATATITVIPTSDGGEGGDPIPGPEPEEPTTTTVEVTPEEPTTTTVEDTPVEPDGSITVYFSNNKWWTGTINAYIWGANEEILNGPWPGSSMTFVETNNYGESIYKVEIPAGAENIIFNDGVNQTTDIPVSALYDGVGIYVMDNEEGFGTYTYVEAPAESETTTTQASAVEPTTTTQASEVVPVETITVYFSNAWMWTDITVYFWGSASETSPEFPGAPMTFVETNDMGQDIYKATIPADATGMLFAGKDNGADTQSPDITDIKDGYGYYMNWTAELGNHVGSYEYVPTVKPATTTTAAAITTATQTPVIPEPTEKTYSVAGAVAPGHVDGGAFGEPWNLNVTDNDLVYDEETGLWSVTYTDVAKSAANEVYEDTWYEYTIVADHNWDLSYNHIGLIEYPTNEMNAQFDVEEDGSTVTIYFNGEYCWAEVVAPELPPVDPADTYTVYFVDYPDNFTQVYAYAWSVTTTPDSTYDEVSEVAATWPGVKMELTGEALSENAEQAGGLVYSVTFDKAYDYIIFAGNYEVGAEISSKTADLTFEADRYCYFDDELWYDSIADIEAAHPYVEGPEEPAGEFVTVFFQNNWLWDDVSVYFEGSAYAECDTWPGISMGFYDNDGTYDVYYAQVPADASFIIFNGFKDDGTGDRDQTPDITEGFYNGICYFMTWNDGNTVGSMDITELFPEMGGGEGGDPETAPYVTGATLTLGGKLGFTFYFDINDTVMADENAKVQFTVKGETIEVPVSELVNTDYGYSYTIELAAKEMTEVVTAQIFATDFESEIYDNSIEEYALYILNSDDEKYSSAKELVKAMLNYGAAAQVYFGYKTDQPANRDLSVEDKVVTVNDYSDFAPVIEGEADVVEFYGASLILESDTYLKFYFQVDESKLPEGATPNITINGISGATLEKNGELWSIKMTSLAAHELSTEFLLQMDNGHTVTYSVYSYIYKAQQKTNADLVNLANALGAYAYAAGDYGGE